MTGRDLVTAQLKLLGVIAPGEDPSARDAVDALATNNRMIDSFSNDALLISSRVQESFNLVSGTQSYEMGPSADFDTVRPQKIDNIVIRVSGIDYKVNLLSLDEWVSIPNKNVTSSIPSDAYIEGSFPLEKINLYPKPDSPYEILIYSWKPISKIASLDAELSFQPGVEEMLLYNGVVRLAPEYGKAVSAEIAEIARESKALIKSINNSPSYLRVDEALSQGGRFDIYKGDYI